MCKLVISMLLLPWHCNKQAEGTSAGFGTNMHTMFDI